MTTHPLVLMRGERPLRARVFVDPPRPPDPAVALLNAGHCADNWLVASGPNRGKFVAGQATTGEAFGATRYEALAALADRLCSGWREPKPDEVEIYAAHSWRGVLEIWIYAPEGIVNVWCLDFWEGWRTGFARLLKLRRKP